MEWFFCFTWCWVGYWIIWRVQNDFTRMAGRLVLTISWRSAQNIRPSLSSPPHGLSRYLCWTSHNMVIGFQDGKSQLCQSFLRLKARTGIVSLRLHSVGWSESHQPRVSVGEDSIGAWAPGSVVHCGGCLCAHGDLSWGLKCKLMLWCLVHVR